jgi:hypothetical protein
MAPDDFTARADSGSPHGRIIRSKKTSGHPQQNPSKKLSITTHKAIILASTSVV